FSNNDCNQSDTNWTWEISDVPRYDKVKTDKIISDLKKTINELKSEKQDLTSNLELLDSDFQLNTEKLVSLKDKIQADYNDLEEKYTELKEDHEKLLESEKTVNKELENIKSKYQELVEKRNDKVSHSETCAKCETLLQENRRFLNEIEILNNEVTVLNSNNITLHRALEDTKNEANNDYRELKEKLKLCESENKILVAELQKANQSIATFEKKSKVDAENCKKLAVILEGYEQQVSSLKEELLLMKNERVNLPRLEDVNKLKIDFEDVQKALKKANEEKEQTHKKYVNILTENVKKYIDCDKPSEEFSNCSSEVDPQITEYSHQVESMLNILLDLKCKCENLEKDLYNVTQEKTDLLSEKNHEIEKLIQNSEILSQEVITKSQTIKDYENECNELIKNNDILINELEAYKNNSGLQTISESNEDNLLLLETQLENANKKIEELENVIANLENNINKDIPAEDETQQDGNEMNRLLEDNSSLKEEIKKLENVQTIITEEKEKLGLSLEKIKTDLENTEYQYTEMNINMETLKEEIENQKKKIEELIGQNLAMEKLNIEYERNNEDIRSALNVTREKLLFEEDTRKQLENQVRNLTEKLQNAKMCETSLKLQYDTINKELMGMTEAKCVVERSLKNTLDNLAHCQDNLLVLQRENEELKNTAELEKNLQNNKEVIEYDETDVTSRRTEKLIADENGELSTTINQLENIDLSTEINVEDLKQENLKLITNLDEMQLQLDTVIQEKNRLQSEVTKLNLMNSQHADCIQNTKSLEKKVEELIAAKNELTNVVITKHQENITYHNEIQRLSQILNAEAEKARSFEFQLQSAKTAIVRSAEIEKKNEEIDNLTDQNNFLRQKCEILAQNLLEEQNKVQQILAEHSNPSEKEQFLSKKLERLQTHLIEVEEHYTQELLRAEEKNSELQAKVNEIEQREKNSSTMYTSVSIRANQHVETLQHQLQLITNQRDDLRKKISDAEDNSNKQEAALANLQFVLEQFQKDKDKDVQKETERIRRQINVEKRAQEDLKNEIASLHSQLEESKQGLQAASRLSDQLEQSKQSIVTLKGEVTQLKEKLNKSEERLQNLSSQTDGKVDKSLIKNLVIGFVTTNNNLSKDQMQILKIIATVLDFNQQDHDKINLNKSQQGWLSSFLTPQTSQGMSQESLSQAFVKFLENESKPRLVPSLLSNNNESSKSRKNSGVTVPRQSPSILSEVVLPTFADFAQNRNSSSILKDVLKDNS
ncbi:thyroid receptor-interacting protein 11, partial [Asbolus verrucosus]